MPRFQAWRKPQICKCLRSSLQQAAVLPTGGLSWQKEKKKRPLKWGTRLHSQDGLGGGENAHQNVPF